MHHLDKIWRFQNTYLKLPSSFYTEIIPSPISNPKLLLYNKDLANDLGFELLNEKFEYLSDVFSGNYIPEESRPFAQAYGGHQFGYFNTLGDGRAILLGEVTGVDAKKYDIQLKGSGKTPYSRRGDGRATLYSMLREYLISEAMHGLGIPTTRSLAVVKSEDLVYREKVHEMGVLTRIASSHIRVGTFELAARMGDSDCIRKLFDYTLERHYPELKDIENSVVAFLEKVIDRQIHLVNEWMRVGFIHGVMNSDNMSISGETIDYGPCAFMNGFNPNTVFSSIDENGRYAYANQPKMAKWNLMRLAETLLSLIDKDAEKSVEQVQPLFDNFEEKFNELWKNNHLKKIGIRKEQDGDQELLDELMDWMEKEKPDFTNTFRGLVNGYLHKDDVFQLEEFQIWKSKWKRRVASIDGYEECLISANPSIIPRNHLVEEALKNGSEGGDLKDFHAVLEKLKKPYDTYKSDRFQSPPLSDFGYKTFCGT
tara:strand:- start:2902 stop:4347 length:1446 start_codon:yes stop_codon:yes gene_type:complete